MFPSTGKLDQDLTNLLLVFKDWTPERFGTLASREDHGPQLKELLENTLAQCQTKLADDNLAAFHVDIIHEKLRLALGTPWGDADFNRGLNTGILEALKLINERFNPAQVSEMMEELTGKNEIGYTCYSEALRDTSKMSHVDSRIGAVLRDCADQLDLAMRRETLYKTLVDKLWNIIDDIDTADDVAKDNDVTYRVLVQTHQKKRWDLGITTDGYLLKLPDGTILRSPFDRMVTEQVSDLDSQESPTFPEDAVPAPLDLGPYLSVDDIKGGPVNVGVSQETLDLWRAEQQVDNIIDACRVTWDKFLSDPLELRDGPKFTHVKRGSEYTVIGEATLKLSETRRLKDGDALFLYYGKDEKLYAVAVEEFSKFATLDGWSSRGCYGLRVLPLILQGEQTRRLLCGDKLVIYRAHAGNFWARTPDEFYDGRFVSSEPLVAAAAHDKFPELYHIGNP